MDADIIIQYLLIGLVGFTIIGFAIGYWIKKTNIKEVTVNYIEKPVGGLKVWWLNFWKIPYTKIEKIHNGIIQRIFIIKNQDILYDKNTDVKTWEDKEKNKYILKESFKPVFETPYATRYTFENDNIFPRINDNGKSTEIRGIVPKEVLTLTEDGDYFIISNTWLSKMFDTHFVEKIKKEAEDKWASLFEFLKSPSGALLIVFSLLVVGLMVYINAKGGHL
jgi:hypothetical protein